MIGKTISHYKILEKLGEGGMGVVYRARDTKLDRDVAIKSLPGRIAANKEERTRFVIEAKAAAALNHPNIATIHAIEEVDDEIFIIMELVVGQELKERMADAPLAFKESIAIALQVANGLEAAHEKGIVHRDIKPANIMLTPKGEVKIMDFGLAKTVDVDLTQTGTTLGTAAYMSPEQTRGEAVDSRTDIWSLGVVMYEMLTGKRPFVGEYDATVAYEILNSDIEPVSSVNPDLPSQITEIISRALEKNLEDRYASMGAVKADLLPLGSRDLQPAGVASSGSRIRLVVAAAVVLVSMITAALLWWDRNSKIQWARQVALPEIVRLAEAENEIEAFNLAVEAEQYIAGDTTLLKLWPRLSSYYTLHTDPPQAEVFLRAYSDIAGEWQHIGQTPVDSFRHPRGETRIRIEKDGYTPVNLARSSTDSADYTANIALVKVGSDSGGMVEIPAVTAEGWFLLPVGLDHLDRELFNAFLMDAYEVSNVEFKRFVDGGGYDNKALWKHPLLKDGRTLSWDEGIRLFTDKSGQPGPSTWEVQDFPDGQEDYPVTGVSWYEAAAYAEFVGKKLPTLFQWARAAQIPWSAQIVPLSNISGEGPAARNVFQGMSPFGTFDMAGNVREWVLNPSGDREARYLLGGGWNDPDYAFTDAFAQKGFDRSMTNGFRCVIYLESNENQASLERPLARISRDYYAEEPVSDGVFAGFLRQYAYDKTPLNERLEGSDNGFDDWVREKISFDAAYGGERVTAYLFVPKKGTPPYQTVVFFPGSGAISRSSSANLSPGRWDFILKSGRAFLWPIYKSTYERGDEITDDYGDESVYYKNHVIMWANDLSRAVDYLEMRDDFDHEKLAYLGYSWGGASGSIMTVVEPRFKASVLYVAGLYPSIVSPEVDPFNFLPRVEVPTLMLNGKYDFFYPYETSQKPFYEHLTLPEEHRDFYVSEGSHFVPREELVTRTLAWFDRFLGPVQ